MECARRRPTWIAIIVLLGTIASEQIALASFPKHRQTNAQYALATPPPTILPPPGSPPPPVYGFPTTNYRSGWPNTHYWPRKNFHYGFYGDYWQWGYFPGF